jgi:hypothetical protein
VGAKGGFIPFFQLYCRSLRDKRTTAFLYADVLIEIREKACFTGISSGAEECLLRDICERQKVGNIRGWFLRAWEEVQKPALSGPAVSLSKPFDMAHHWQFSKGHQSCLTFDYTITWAKEGFKNGPFSE